MLPYCQGIKQCLTNNAICLGTGRYMAWFIVKCLFILITLFYILYNCFKTCIVLLIVLRFLYFIVMHFSFNY